MLAVTGRRSQASPLNIKLGESSAQSQPNGWTAIKTNFSIHPGEPRSDKLPGGTSYRLKTLKRESFNKRKPENNLNKLH